MSKRIFVVGSINTDLVISTNQIPNEGETIKGNDFFVAKGGKGANQALASSKLGGNCLMCGCVGDDSFGKEAVESLKKNGVDVNFVKTIENTSTGTAVIILHNKNNRIIISGGANEYLSTESIDSFLENANEGDIYVTQMEYSLDVVGYGLKKAKEKGMYVVFNPSPVHENIVPYLSYCDLLIPNETEIEKLGGLDKMLNLIPTIVVTLGSKGYKIVTRNEEKQYPCLQVDAIDTTAAGDTCLGGIVAKLSEGCSIEEACEYGSLAASIACTRIGAQPSIPNKEEIDNIIRKID